MSDIILKKKELRKELLAKRKALTIEEKNYAALDCLSKLLALPAYEDAMWIYVYIACRNELETMPIMEQAWKDGKHVLVPKVHGDIMHFYEIHSIEDCELGAFHILEPKEGLSIHTEPGLMLLPGLAFDRENYRMGYGGGFYDKYLSTHEGLTTYALGYDFQLVDQVPRESHDMALEGSILGKTVSVS